MKYYVNLHETLDWFGIAMGKNISRNRLTEPGPFLGDAWKDWKGRLTAPEVDADSGKGLFLSLSASALCLLCAASYMLLYLVSPRLGQFHETLPRASMTITNLFWILTGLACLIFMIRVSTMRKTAGFFPFFPESLARAFLPPARFLARLLGISQDRVGNSFVKVHNAALMSRIDPGKIGKVLVLLPRCLEKPVRESVIRLCENRNIQYRIAEGGEKARDWIRRIEPHSVIAAACERDLVGGILDISGRIPVIGIPNARPQGPCKNTVLDLDELERALDALSERRKTPNP